MRFSKILYASWVLLALIIATHSISADPVDATFTYQGKLTDGSGSPITGTRDLQFKLFDAATNGVQVGSTITMTGQSLVDGLFTVKLNFGTTSFNGQKRWLETTVGTETLSPRVEITASPVSGSTASVGTNVTTVSAGGNLQASINAVAAAQGTTNPQCCTVLYDNENVLKPSTLSVPWFINLAPLYPNRVSPKPPSAPVLLNCKPKSILSLTIDDVYSDLTYPNPPAGTAGHVEGLPVGQTPLEWLRQNGVAPMLAIQPDEPSRIASGRSNLDVIRTAVLAAGCDLASHGYHAHSSDTNPYRASNDTDSKIIQTMNEELRRSHDAICALTGTNDDGQQIVLTGTCPVFVQPGQGWTGDAYIECNEPAWISKTQSTYGQIIRNTYEAARTYYGQDGSVWNSVYDEWYTYLEISPDGRANCLSALDACANGVVQVGMFCHSITQDAFDVMSKAIALRDQGLLEIVSSAKARLIQFNGTTDYVTMPGGQLSGLPTGNLGNLVWYCLHNGSVLPQEINSGLVAFRPVASVGSGSASVVDEDSKRWIKLSTADGASQEMLQVSVPVLRGGLQYQFQCTLKVPAGGTATFRLQERRTIGIGTTQAAMSRINGHYDDVTLGPGTYRYTRSFVVPLGQRGASLKFVLLNSTGSSQIMMTDWGVL